MTGGRSNGGRLSASAPGVPTDTVLVVAWLAVASGATLLPAGSPPRVFVALATLLVLPGYALTTALFPAVRSASGGASRLRFAADSSPLAGAGDATSTARAEAGGPAALTGTERAALSFGFSLAALPLAGLAVEVVYGTFALEPLLVVLAALVLASTGVGVVRRLRTPTDRRYDLPVERALADARAGVERTNGLDLALNVALAAVVLLSVSTLAVALAAPQDGTHYTEVQLLAQQPDGEWAGMNYPTEFERGESRPLLVAVSNREKQPVDYTVVVALQRVENGTVSQQTVLNRFQSRVDAGDTWREPHDVTPTTTGDRLRLAYLVYRGSPPRTPTLDTAYRNVSLDVRVNGSRS